MVIYWLIYSIGCSTLTNFTVKITANNTVKNLKEYQYNEKNMIRMFYVVKQNMLFLFLDNQTTYFE